MAKSRKSSRKSKRFEYQKRGVRRLSGKKGSCDKRVMSREMRAFKEGKLYSGNGQKVTSRPQAIAIALSITRKSCKKGPRGRPQNKGRRSKKSRKSSRRHSKKSRKSSRRRSKKSRKSSRR